MEEVYGTPKKGFRLEMLSLNNYSTWKDTFVEVCFSYGDAGRIIITGKDNIVSEPQFNEIIGVSKVHTAPRRKGEKGVADAADAAVPIRKYPETDAGMTAYRNDCDKYTKIIDKKMSLMGLLLRHLEQPVKDKLSQQHKEYEVAKTTFDVLTVWNLIERVLRGTGSVSATAETLRLMKMKQNGDSFPTFLKKYYYDIVKNLRKLRDVNKVDFLEVLVNTLFPLGLDQEEFTDILDREVFTKAEWPAFEDLVDDLTQYSENKERIVKIMNGEPDDDAISANLAKSGGINRRSNHSGGGSRESSSGTAFRFPYECWNCEDSHNRAVCPEPPHECEICGELGHTKKHHNNPRRIEYDSNSSYGYTNNHQSKAQPSLVSNKKHGATSGAVPSRSAAAAAASVGNNKLVLVQIMIRRRTQRRQHSAASLSILPLSLIFLI